jgi:glyoxylase-like metal-dependent hydrolase (beta-lactamase superfamily II)
MFASLRRLLGEIPSQTRILPGHGPETTMAQEAAWLVRIARSGFLATPD